MTQRRAGGGGSAVRFAFAALLAVCVAVAVLIHHEMPMLVAPPASASSGHAAHAVMDGAADDKAPSAAEPSVASPSERSAGAAGCAAPGTAHCNAAGIDSVQLAVPDQGVLDPFADLRSAAAGRVPGGVASRAPPDLSALSVLRI
ncbi:DUF6153 family protein [Streptomyces sp. NPDC048644]|uniref:DUF6153 family protein n=1 Tax=Streptomyces sp. NPDC048644 TaxID=3365582 RepID=UPI00371C108F